MGYALAFELGILAGISLMGAIGYLLIQRMKASLQDQLRAHGLDLV